MWPLNTRTRAWPTLALIAALAVVEATFACGRVEETVGRHILDERQVTVPDAIVIVLAAGALTMLYNYLRIPTSTIQILVFCVIGVGLGGGIPVHWATIGALAVVWVVARSSPSRWGFCSRACSIYSFRQPRPRRSRWNRPCASRRAEPFHVKHPLIPVSPSPLPHSCRACNSFGLGLQ